MSTDDLEELLARMPEIAKAVNEFTSEAVQLAAFEALVGSHDGPARKSRSTSNEPDTPPGGKPTAKRPRKRTPAKPSNGKPVKRKAAGSPTLDKNLNLRPGGKVSLKDFVVEKAPTDNMQRSIVAVYYLSHVLQLDAVTADAVFTCYREMSWKLPGDFRNHLQTIASRKGWLDTSDTDAITMTASGINFVEHDLPKSAKT